MDRKKMKVVLITSGCKTNQADSAMMSEDLSSRGIEFSHEFGKGDIYIINTCTVTHHADRDARSAINRARDANPSAKVIVTGCYAQNALSNGRVPAGENVYFLGNGEKENLVGLILGGCPPLEERCAGQDTGKTGGVTLRPISGIRYMPRLHARPFLKIQDGCNYKCAYCIVPSVRGGSRSIPADEVTASLRRYEELGAREVVLTAVHLGDYGKDLDGGGMNLMKLLEKISSLDMNLRLRLSSLEPHEIPAEMISLVGSSKTFCRHFHIPLQSGSDEILKKMKRPYSAAFYSEVAERIRELIPDAAIGMDVIAGFPTEGEIHFMETLSLVKSLDFTYMHVFPFSPREGTAAFEMPGHVPDGVKKERCAELI
ncbi:MAG: MiaB/RimO family radical SAM methylthiotransferase, partial [Deltaproteobacteria bacterium]|nr:MiaB/RimO family radical SAM methylthiotransferase [Deltaproteobacteria bacterium]